MDSRFSKIGRNIATPDSNPRGNNSLNTSTDQNNRLQLLSQEGQDKQKNDLQNDFRNDQLAQNNKPKLSKLEEYKLRLKERQGIQGFNNNRASSIDNLNHNVNPNQQSNSNVNPNQQSNSNVNPNQQSNSNVNPNQNNINQNNSNQINENQNQNNSYQNNQNYNNSSNNDILQDQNQQRNLNQHNNQNINNNQQGVNEQYNLPNLNQNRSIISNNNQQNEPQNPNNINLDNNINLNKNLNQMNQNNSNSINLNPNFNNDIRTVSNIGSIQKPTYNRDSQAEELKRQMDEAKQKKQRMKDELRKEDEKLLKYYDQIDGKKEVKTSIKIVSRENSPEVKGVKTVDNKYTNDLHNPQINNKDNNNAKASQLDIGAESDKLANERNRKENEFKEILKQQVEEKKRKELEKKRLEEEKDRLAEEKLKKQIQEELDVDHDPKKHRKTNQSKSNLNTFVSDNNVTVLVKEKPNKTNINKTESVSKIKSPLKEIKETDPDTESSKSQNNISQINAKNTMNAEQMMQQINDLQKDPNNKNQYNELEQMQKELRRQREDMEETIAVLKRQTNSVREDSQKYQNDLNQMKMQIDLNKERELLIKQMYDSNMNNMRNEIELYKEKLVRLEEENEIRKLEIEKNNNKQFNKNNNKQFNKNNNINQNHHPNQNINHYLNPNQYMNSNMFNPGPNPQLPSHYKILNNNDSKPTDELPTQSKLVEIPQMDKSFMIQKQKQFQRENYSKNKNGNKMQEIQTKTQPDLTYNRENHAMRNEHNDKYLNMMNIDEKELKNLDDEQPDSEQFDKSMNSPHKGNKNRNQKYENPNLMDSDDDEDNETVDSFAQRNSSRILNRNEFSKKDLQNNNNYNKNNKLNDSLGNISNPNLLDSDED